MAHIELEAGGVSVRMTPMDEILAMHGSLRMPYSHIRSVTTDPVPSAWFHGWRLGTDIPGIKVAGTFFTGEGVVFYDFHDRMRCLTFELAHEHYRRVVVQVDKGQDPVALAKQVTARLGLPTN